MVAPLSIEVLETQLTIAILKDQIEKLTIKHNDFITATIKCGFKGVYNRKKLQQEGKKLLKEYYQLSEEKIWILMHVIEINLGSKPNKCNNEEFIEEASKLKGYLEFRLQHPNKSSLHYFSTTIQPVAPQTSCSKEVRTFAWIEMYGSLENKTALEYQIGEWRGFIREQSQREAEEKRIENEIRKNEEALALEKKRIEKEFQRTVEKNCLDQAWDEPVEETLEFGNDYDYTYGNSDGSGEEMSEFEEED